MAAVSSSFAHLQCPCYYLSASNGQPEQDLAQEKERTQPSHKDRTKQH